MSLIISAETRNGGVWHPTLLEAQINKKADRARDAQTSAAIVECIIPGANPHDAMPSWGAVEANPTWSPQVSFHPLEYVGIPIVRDSRSVHRPPKYINTIVCFPPNPLLGLQSVLFCPGPLV